MMALALLLSFFYDVPPLRNRSALQGEVWISRRWPTMMDQE